MGTRFICRPSTLRGSVAIPGSKSHTIRAVAIAALAEGTSRIRLPLVSNDTLASVRVFRALGAGIETADGLWTVKGTGGALTVPDDVLDVGNSGVTLRTALGAATLLTDGGAIFTGDAQIRSRPNGPLVGSLNDLGAEVWSTRGEGLVPLSVRGTLKGGTTSIQGHTSQYVSSLLMCAPLAEGESHIRVPVLNEKPYVEITLDWLRRQGIRFQHAGLEEFRVPGGQTYQPVDRAVPADFSSATFFLVAGALGANDVTSTGLDVSDTQGDKAVLDYLRRMGARVEVEGDRIRVTGGELVGTEIDLNATPDALPMLAVAGCFARGTTRLVNCPQARIKETDRIEKMAAELSKLGAKVEELPDGLVVHESRLTGGEVDGHDDHRIVMALAVAGMAAEGNIVIHSAEAAAVTFPTFASCLQALGGTIEVNDDCNQE